MPFFDLGDVVGIEEANTICAMRSSVERRGVMGFGLAVFRSLRLCRRKHSSGRRTHRPEGQRDSRGARRISADLAGRRLRPPSRGREERISPSPAIRAVAVGLFAGGQVEGAGSAILLESPSGGFVMGAERQAHVLGLPPGSPGRFRCHKNDVQVEPMDPESCADLGPPASELFNRPGSSTVRHWDEGVAKMGS